MSSEVMTFIAEQDNGACGFECELSERRFYSIYPQRSIADGSWAWGGIVISTVFCKWDQEELMDLWQ